MNACLVRRHLSPTISCTYTYVAEKIYLAQIPTDPKTRWATTPPIMEELKKKAKARGLWNLFLSKAHYPDVGVPLTNLEVRSYFHTFIYDVSNAGMMYSMPSWPRLWAELVLLPPRL